MQRGKSKPTPEEVFERNTFVLRLLQEGLPRRKAIGLICEKYGVVEGTASGYLREMLMAQKSDFEHERAYFKSAQAGRVSELAHLAVKSGNLNAAIRAESLLADIIGTKEPIRIQHEEFEIQKNILAIIGNMSPEQIRAIADEERKLEELAEIGKKALAEKNSTQDE